VRLLTNLETETQKLLQIILIGQPELRDMLARTDLRQLAQRITQAAITSIRCRATKRRPTSSTACAWPAPPPTCSTAVRCASSTGVSGGVPRLLNIIADRALLGAYSEDRHLVNAAMVRRAAAEVSGQRVVPVWLPSGLGIASLVLLAGVSTLVLQTAGSPSMSLILEALRKAEQERSRQGGPDCTACRWPRHARACRCGPC
jgi:general secretion pathway protein A